MTVRAFVKLEEGIEGLVHVSEMSWTKRTSHSDGLVYIEDKVQRHQAARKIATK